MDFAAAHRHISGMQLTVSVSHDEKDGVWFVRSSDVPGLNAEASSFDALLEVILDVAPDLVTANMPDAFRSLPADSVRPR